MKTAPLGRRTFLRGLGSISVGFPFLEEMLGTPSIAYAEPGGNSAQSAMIPPRAFNLFFGLGIPAPLQEEGYEGVLEPLQPFAKKLQILRQVDQIRCDGKGINAHFDGASGAFTATPPNGEARAGGASIDQLIRRNHHPNGLPAGVVPTLVAGTFFRRSRVGRYIHSYNPDGSIAATMQERPMDLFDRVFGSLQMGEEDQTYRERRLKRSVLDSMVEQYKFYTGHNSPLGQSSKSRIADHLDRIREYEKRAFSQQRAGDADAPPIPPRSKVLHGGQADPGGEGIDLTLNELTTEWHLMADLYALAIQMDRVRFGSLTFLAAGERIRLTGDYHFDGEKRYEFNDRKHLNASGSKGCSHEYWHQYREEKDNKHLRMHAHMKMRELAYFLNKLDKGENAIEANGRSILENTFLTISTESGDGRHNDVKRELSGIFHAVTSANGVFKTGGISDVQAEGIDVYNTMLQALKIRERLGPKEREHRPVDSIRA